MRADFTPVFFVINVPYEDIDNFPACKIMYASNKELVKGKIQQESLLLLWKHQESINHAVWDSFGNFTCQMIFFLLLFYF